MKKSRSISPLDAIDLKILAALQSDSGRPVAEIAEQVHLSVNACWRRIKRYEAEGLIRKRVALLDPQALGAPVTVFVSVRAGRHSDDWLDQFARGVTKIPEVTEFYRMGGEVDYLLKVQVSDIAAYDAVYRRLIRIADMADVSAAFAMEELKHTTELPLPDPA